MSDMPVVRFKNKHGLIACECGEFEIDLDLTLDAREQAFAHAKTHNPDVSIFSVSLIEEF